MSLYELPRLLYIYKHHHEYLGGALKKHVEHVKALLDFQGDLTSESTKKGMNEAKEKGN